MAEFSKPKIFSDLRAISSLDGRFRGNVEKYSDYFSEFSTMKHRLEIELKYLIAIMDFFEENTLRDEDKRKLLGIYENFSEKDALWIQNKDLVINHDTKSVEYFINDQLETLQLNLSHYVHIGITSADIDNNALILSIKRFEQDILSSIRKSILFSLERFIEQNRDSIFLAKTHGKQAVPTTMAKEAENFLFRLRKIDNQIQNHIFEGKLSGAVGNLNALYSAYPQKSWKTFSKHFITSLDLLPNLYTTQVLPYDNIIQYLNFVSQFNSILIDLARDFWLYISFDLLLLEFNKNEVGSSTMPHKVNPISFEGAEAYLLLSTNQISFFSKELSTNRLQRDLTDKYISREVGVSLVQAALGYSMIIGGVNNVVFNAAAAEEELDKHWEILAEAIQTILRTEGFSESYELLKSLTMGKNLTKNEFLSIIDEMQNIPEDLKDRFKRLSPKSYLGWAQSTPEDEQ